ncbi:MAG: hypothetical protein ACRDJE_18115 [Dehalococcoidia bacterium]
MAGATLAPNGCRGRRAAAYGESREAGGHRHQQHPRVMDKLDKRDRG